MVTGDELLKRLHDPNEYVVYSDVAVLDEHDLLDDKGEKVGRIDEEKLRKIADNNNRLIRERGSPCPVVIGHTHDPNKHGESKPESNQPEVVGFATDFRVDNLPNSKEKAVFCRFHIYKADAARVEKKYPYRSVELWTNRWSFHPISVLGATAPERDLGMLVRHMRQYSRGQERVATFLNTRPMKRYGMNDGSPNSWADEYGKAGEYADIDPKLANTIMAVLEKSPVWKLAKQITEGMEQGALTIGPPQPAPAPPTMAGPMDAGTAPPGDPNAIPPGMEQGPPPEAPQPGADMAAAPPNQASPPGQGDLTPEEMQELMGYLRQMGQASPSPAVVKQSRNGKAAKNGKPVKKSESNPEGMTTKRCTQVTPMPGNRPSQHAADTIEDESDDDLGGDPAPMARPAKGKKKYEFSDGDEDDLSVAPLGENDDGQWMGDDEDDQEEVNDDDGSDNFPVGDESSDDPAMGDMGDEGDGNEWQDEDGGNGEEAPGDQDDGESYDPEGSGDEEEPEEMSRKGNPKKKGGFNSPGGGFMPTTSTKPVPSRAGGTEGPRRRVEMKNKPRKDLDSNGKAEFYSRKPQVARTPEQKAILQLQRQLNDLKAENELLRVNARYSRRKADIHRLIGEGYDIDSPADLFEKLKDADDTAYGMVMDNMKRFARQSGDPARVAFFDTTPDENSVLDSHREVTASEARDIGDIVRKENCDFAQAKKILFQRRRQAK